MSSSHVVASLVVSVIVVIGWLAFSQFYQARVANEVARTVVNVEVPQAEPAHSRWKKAPTQPAPEPAPEPPKERTLLDWLRGE